MKPSNPRQNVTINEKLSLYITGMTLVLLTLIAQLAPPPADAPAPPETPAVFYLSAQVETLVAERRYQEALQILEAASHIYPQAPQPLIQIGQIYLVQHRWLMAEDAFNRALARDINHPSALAGLAEALLHQERFDQAIRLWQRAAAVNPTKPGLSTGLGRAYVQQLDFPAAQEAFAQQPDSQAHWYLAALLAPDDILTARHHLYAISPAKDSPLLAQRDYLLETLAPFEVDSPPAEVAKATGLALAQVDMWPLALHAFTIAVAEQGNQVEAETVAFLAEANFQVGRPAFDLFELARQLDPDSPLILLMQGRYFREKVALKAAGVRFAEAILLDQQNPVLYAEMAATKAAQGNIGAAEAWYRAALELATDQPSFQLMVARFYAQHNYRVAEAGLPLVEAVIAAEPTNASAYELLGRMQFIIGQLAEAEATFRQALELNPELITARYHLARTLTANGKLMDARTEYQKVIDWDRATGLREQAQRDLQRLG